METEIQKRIDIPTSVAARILGCAACTIRKYRHNGRLKTGVRMNKAPHSPWKFDRLEIYQLKDALSSVSLRNIRD